MTTRLHKDGDSLGVSTDAKDESQFIEEFRYALTDVAADFGDDLEFQLAYWLPNMIDIVCSFRGYKNSANVYSVRTAGEAFVLGPSDLHVIAEYSDHVGRRPAAPVSTDDMVKEVMEMLGGS